MSSNTGSHVRNRHGGEGSAGGGVRTRDTHGPPGFSPAVTGMSYGDARDGEQSQNPDLAPGSVDGGTIGDAVIEATHIVPETLSLDLFAETIRPPSIVDTLPVLPDASYIEGQLAFLTTDGKLYRNVADVWTVEVDGADILANSITAGQIATGAIAADEIAAGAITTEKFHVGAKAPGVENSTSEVLIDSDGITILNGKITLYDLGGVSALSAGGFGGSWIDFLNSRVYNSYFGYGSATGTDLVASEVSGGDSVADYAASLSSILPYWVVVSAAGECELYADPASPTGRSIRMRADGLNPGTEFRIYQDIPVVPGNSYQGVLSWRWNISGTNEVTREIRTSWRDSTHAIIGSAQADGLAYMSTSSSSVYEHEPIELMGGDEAPPLAAYIRVEIDFEKTVGTTQLVYLGGLRVREITQYGFVNIVSGTDSSLTDGTGFLQIGESGGQNISIDNNEIVSRDGSGAGAELFLNAEGGQVSINSTSGTGGLRVMRGGLRLGTSSSPAMSSDISIMFGSDIELYREAADTLRTKAGDTLYGSAVGRWIIKSGIQSISNVAYTVVSSWSTTEWAGAGVAYDGSDEFVVDRAGVYLVMIRAAFTSHGSGIRMIGIGINDATSAAMSAYYQERHPVNSDTNDEIFHSIFMVSLAANDRVCMKVWQNTGGSLNLTGASISMVMLGH